MRRPRPCLARVDPGGLASPSEPTMRLCLQWLDGAGEGWAKACLDGELRFAPVPEVRPQGRRNRCDGASERRFCYYQGASFRRSISPQKGERTKSPTRAAARGRERLAV